MSTGKGISGYLGAGKETTYRTAVTVTDKIPLLSEGITQEYARIESMWFDGNAGKRGDNQGPMSVQGPVEFALVHDELDSGEWVGCNLPLALAMGTATWDAVNSSNQLTLASELSTSMTIAIEKAVSVHEVVSAIPKGFTLSGGAGEIITASMDLIAYDYLITGQTNASADLSTLPSVIPTEILFCDNTFRMATDMSDALAAGDKVSISNFTLTYDAMMSDPEFATPLNAASDPYGTVCGKTMKPERNGFRNVTLEIRIPRYTADTWRTAMNNDSAIQADFTLYTSASKVMYIYLPFMKVTNVVDSIAGESFIEQVVTLQAFRGASYNSGGGNTVMHMQDGSTNIDEEFAIETINDRAAVVFS